MAEEGDFLNSLRSPISEAPQQAAFPLPTSENPDSTENAQAAQPRTIGGFVDEDDEDDADEEEVPRSKSMSASSEYEPNIDGGPQATAPQQELDSAHTTAARPPSSRPQSSMAFPPPVSSNTDHQDQNMSDSAPVQQQATADAPVSNGVTTDAVHSPSALSQTPTAGRASVQPPPLDVPSNVSRPTTANGNGAQSSMAGAPAARLPSDRVGILEDRILEDPKGDTDAWLSLIEEYKRRGKLAEVRKTYDNFLALFPTDVSLDFP